MSKKNGEKNHKEEFFLFLCINSKRKLLRQWRHLKEETLSIYYIINYNFTFIIRVCINYKKKLRRRQKYFLDCVSGNEKN